MFQPLTLYYPAIMASYNRYPSYPALYPRQEPFLMRPSPALPTYYSPYTDPRMLAQWNLFPGKPLPVSCFTYYIGHQIILSSSDHSVITKIVIMFIIIWLLLDLYFNHHHHIAPLRSKGHRGTCQIIGSKYFIY